MSRFLVLGSALLTTPALAAPITYDAAVGRAGGAERRPGVTAGLADRDDLDPQRSVE